MNTNFPEWYRRACVDPTDEKLKARWQGIEAFCEDDFGSNEVLELIRL